jgi:hypothetical protein
VIFLYVIAAALVDAVVNCVWDSHREKVFKARKAAGKPNPPDKSWWKFATRLFGFKPRRQK